MEGTNAIGSHEAGFFTRWSRDERKYVQLRVWKVHPFFGKHYGSGDQGTMWRNEGNGHKYRTNKQWQALRDYLLWGLPVVCAYLNRKLSCSTDVRPIQKFKHSLVSYTIENTPSLRFRKRQFPQGVQRNNRRSRTNRYKCVLGERATREKKLLAAQHCERTTGRRMISIADHFRIENKRLSCARCGSNTSYACLSCGVALCTKTFTSRANRLPVCCMDICHLRWRYNLENGKVLRPT